MIAVLQTHQDERQDLFDRLTAKQIDNPNQIWLGRIVASWLCGQGVLPDHLGLEPEQFAALDKNLFANYQLPQQAPSRICLDDSRMLEKEDLIQLLQSFRRDNSQEIDWLIGLIVSACLGSDHLWQDLGVWQRSELSALLAYNFPELATRNNKDMKWKKFLYKQLCEAEGLHLCRAPSCEVCADYSGCFGSEE